LAAVSVPFFLVACVYVARSTVLIAPAVMLAGKPTDLMKLKYNPVVSGAVPGRLGSPGESRLF